MWKLDRLNININEENKFVGGPFNVGNGQPVKLIDIAKFISNYLGSRLKI